MLDSKPETLADLSSLTKIQIETLQLHVAIRKAEINVSQALQKRKNFGISRGTHYRILSQARKNIRESIFTVAVAVQLGLIKQEDVQKLISTVSSVPLDIQPERMAEVVALATVLAERIVMS